MAKPISELLRSRYPVKTHALLFEVRNAAGFDATRTLDALAISTWPSRGLKLMGFEIKASRADWKRELADPEKADGFAVYCDEFYIVADGPRIVEADEVPAAWGWLQRLGDRLTCQKPAPPLAASPLPRGMLAAMLKNAIDAASVPGKAEFQRGYEAGKVAGEEQGKHHRDYEREQLRDLRAAVTAFEQASGVRIQSWDAARIGEAVNMVLRGEHQRHIQTARNMLHSARELVTTLERLSAIAVPLPTPNGDGANSSAVPVTPS